METVAVWIVRLLGVYAAIGLVFSIPFVLRGVNRIDPVAAQGTWGFRLIIIPGVVAATANRTPIFQLDRGRT